MRRTLQIMASMESILVLFSKVIFSRQ
uniref:Uncharacterized protein n=1 Tax=Anguilla anguilla TaxID=7936 RepID=A0A0E9XRV4_ANGAN